MRTYYFPIKSECLAHYFGCACLKPSKYFMNKPQDIQNSFENFLLITTSKGCIECNCCLEIVLTNEEETELISAGGTWYLFGSSLPITRVKKIHFTEEQQKNRTLTNIRMGTAFVPDSIVGAVCTFEDASVKEVEAPKDCYVKNQVKEIELYDRILGALIIMRLAREKYMNFSETYIETLAVFNKLIAKILFANDFYNAWKFAPFLMISVVFGGMCGLLGGMFAAVKQSRINAMSSFSGACINIMLNIPLTFFFNALGASFATLMSYFTVWLIRLYKSYKLFEFTVETKKDALNYFVLLLQAVVQIAGLSLLRETFIEIILFVLVLYFSRNNFMLLLNKLLKR